MKQKSNTRTPAERLIGQGIGYVSFRPRSRKEIEDYFTQKARRFLYTPEDISRAIDRLEELGYINDDAFARLFIESRNRSKPKSKKILALELKRKGISQECIELALKDIFTSEDTQVSEYELARKAVGNRLNRWEKLPKLEKFSKISGFLLRRGFSRSIISSIVDGNSEKD